MNPIPLEALKQHLAILGKAGSGKTYTAKGIAEGMLDRKERVCVIDPTDVWWGLKSKYPVIVFGGKKADLPLGAQHGETLAEAIGTSSTPAVIVTAEMRTGERVRFFTDFAEGLLRKNKGPLHLIIDEAHIFAPQGKVPDPQSGAMLHAANNLVALGRARGLRITMITQRPAKLHKDSLTQIETLIAMRLIAPQDKEAVREWIKDQADPVKGAEIIASLPTLKTGEGYIYAPEIGILKKASFPKIKTFDSSRAPDAAEKGKGPKLKPIKLQAIKGKLEAVVKEAAAKDPTALQKRVRELEGQLAKGKAPAAPVADPKAVAAAQKAGYALGYEEGYLEARADALTHIKKVEAALLSKKPPRAPAAPARAIPAQAIPAPARGARGSVVVADVPQKERPSPQPLTEAAQGPARRIIASLQFWLSIGNANPSLPQVAMVAEYKPGGGHFMNTIRQMRAAGDIDFGGGRMTLQKGDGAAQPMSMEEARAKMLAVLDGPQQKIIAAFKGQRDPLTLEEISTEAGFSGTGGHFMNNLRALRRIEILEKGAEGDSLAPWAAELLA